MFAKMPVAVVLTTVAALLGAGLAAAQPAACAPAGASRGTSSPAQSSEQAASSAGVAYGASQKAGQGEPAYYTENYTGPAEEEGPESKVAYIRVRLPAGAELRINDTKTKQTGTVREFVTGDLDPERVYTFLLHARWEEDGITVEKSLKVKAFAGNRVTVNFVRPAAPARPRPVVRAPAIAPSYPIQQGPPHWVAPYP